MFVLAMGKLGARELNYSSDIDLIVLFDETRHDPDGLCRAAPGLHPRDAAAGEAALGGDRGGLRLSHRPAASARPVGHAGLHRDRAGRALLRERRADLGARRLHQGARLSPARWRRARRFLEPASAVHLAAPPRLRCDRGRAGHAAADPGAQGPDRAAAGAGPRHQARPGRHPRDRVLHPDPPAHRRRPRPGAAPARDARGARRAGREGLGRPGRRGNAGRRLCRAPRAGAPAADARGRPDPDAAGEPGRPRAARGLLRPDRSTPSARN